ncbi:MAG: hypothetical protein ACYDHB_10990 [Candidatus Dormibacteria bacterium]
MSFTITILVMVVVGGLRSVWGVPFGVFAILALNAALQTYGPSLLPAGGTDIPIIGYGVVLILFLMFLPGGLASAAQRLWRIATGSEGPRRSIPQMEGAAVSEEPW